MFEFNLKNLSSDYFETSKEIIDELLGRKPISKALKNYDIKTFNELNENEDEEQLMNKENINMQKKIKNKGFHKNYQTKSFEKININCGSQEEWKHLNLKKNTKDDNILDHSRISSKNIYMNDMLNEVINKNEKRLSLYLKENKDSSLNKKEKKEKVLRPKSDLRRNKKNDLEIKKEIKDFEKSKEFQIRDQKIVYMKKL